MNPTELAWAAGLFEGEGSIRINTPTRRNRGHLVVDMVNTDEEIVAFFDERWPGYFRKVKGKGERRDFWRWRAASLQAAEFLRAIEPYVRSRRVRDKLTLGLAFQAQKSRNPVVNRTPAYLARQQDFYERMGRLNLRGLAKDADLERRRKEIRDAADAHLPGAGTLLP